MTELAKALNSVKWKFSRRGNGHEYILEKHHPKLVHKVNDIIKKDGYDERYRTMIVRYWEYAGYKYWVMPGIRRYGNNTLVLNRVALKPATLNNF